MSCTLGGSPLFYLAIVGPLLPPSAAGRPSFAETFLHRTLDSGVLLSSTRSTSLYFNVRSVSPYFISCRVAKFLYKFFLLNESPILKSQLVN